MILLSHDFVWAFSVYLWSYCGLGSIIMILLSHDFVWAFSVYLWSYCGLGWGIQHTDLTVT